MKDKLINKTYLKIKKQINRKRKVKVNTDRLPAYQYIKEVKKMRECREKEHIALISKVESVCFLY